MRAIRKPNNNGNYYLNQANVNPPQSKEQATSRWKSYSHKNNLLETLLKEQFFLCCYSEIRADLMSLGYHIEHVEPKSLNPQRTFDYQNLAASALDSENDLRSFNTLEQEVFAGHAKLDKYNANLFISCHQTGCARFFAYLSDGRIVPTLNLNSVDTAKADYTINTLNLNSPYLIVLRQQWWKELDALFQQHQQDNWSIEHLAAVDLVPINNKLSPFFSLTRQFFDAVAENVLRHQAPQLI